MADLKPAGMGLLAGALLAGAAAALSMPAPTPQTSPQTSPVSTLPPATPVTAPVPASSPTPTPAQSPSAAPAAGPATAAGEAPPPPPLPVGQLLGLSGQPVPPPAGDGGPPQPGWSVQTGFFGDPGHAEQARRKLSLWWPGVGVASWSDQQGRIWFTLALPALNAPAANDLATHLRSRGWHPVQVVPPAAAASPAGKAGKGG